ncbi:hypothetical protein [Sulfurimonas sp.]|uniref:hypothetical protein n=1 Tax=Sulfurimonas sp. TaxID=2022749 RepID=UPI0025E69ECB|nr:hypothetical protein [Sulfurimonas sp.]MDD5157769.1 hypothetical protein [Sulfurimonas sp.]
MGLLFILLLPFLLFALSPFETPKFKYKDTSIFNTPIRGVTDTSLFNTKKFEKIDTGVYDTKDRDENTKASKNSQIICRYVCDKKVYKEQKIVDAVEFYKRERGFK